MSLTLNQKLEMIKLREEGMSRAESGRNKALLHRTAKSWVQRKISWRKWKVLLQWTHERWGSGTACLIADVKKVWGIRRDNQSSQLPLSQSLVYDKVVNLFNSLKAGRAEETAGEKSAASRGWFVRFKERSCLLTPQCKVKQAVLM